MKTRFAPSPTGSLHLGGLRVAAINKIFALAVRGKFLLRIDDTDAHRNIEGCAEEIIEDLGWALRIFEDNPVETPPWDEGPVFAAQRMSSYHQAARELLDKGAAYRCFATEEELQNRRNEQLAAGHPPRPGRIWRDRDPREQKEMLARGAEWVLRLKMPLEGMASWEDLVRGKMGIGYGDLDDPVLLRRDGAPTYHLASVVDDHDFEVTHVFRGADWIASTPIHLALAAALGFPAPQFGHIPLLMSPDGSKLSKRKGRGFTLREFRESGYLPQSLVQAVLLAGGSNPELEREMKPLCWPSLFKPQRLGQADSRWDRQHLDALQRRHMRVTRLERLLEEAAPFIAVHREHYLGHPSLPAAVELMRGESLTLADLAEKLDIVLEAKPPETTPENRELLAALTAALRQLEPFNGVRFKDTAGSIGKKLGLQGRSLWHPLRLQMTGREKGPELVRLVEIWGREETLKRLSVAGDKQQ